jgi:UDP-3-O-[3-hydroxymyristoyl] N-acetylglucosamine deacetylase
MDGLHDRFAPPVTTATQTTLKASIGCVGVGLHGGARVSVTLRPAPAGHGIVFRRTDLGASVCATFDRVVDTRLCTVIAGGGARVATIEHLMAAFAGSGIDNALVEVDGPELPILDGSAAGFLFLIECAGVEEQSAARRAVEVLRPVRVTDGEAFAELRPSRDATLDLSLSIAFPAAAIGRQALTMRLSSDSFAAELSRARTFTLAEEVEMMRAAGLARGGSLDNAVVVDGARVLNPGGLRMRDEFVRHKMLDAVGDLALIGGPIHGSFTGHRSGHTLNNRLLRALMADAGAWRMAEPADVVLQMSRQAA